MVIVLTSLTAAPLHGMPLQPLAVDWREKLKGTRKGSKLAGASGSASLDPTSPPQSPGTEGGEVGLTTSDGKPNLELLSKGLPAGWRAMWDKSTGDIYYGNLKTRVRFCLP